MKRATEAALPFVLMLVSLCSTWPIDRQEMTDDRLFGSDMVGQNLALQVGVGIGNPLVLAKVLGPGFHHEPFDDLFRIGTVFGDTPSIGSVAAPFLGECIERMQEGAAMLLLDLVFDQDQDRTTIMGKRARQRAARANGWTVPCRHRRPEA